MKMEQRPIPLQIGDKPKSEFVRKLEKKWSQDNFVCVGLDSDYSKIPNELKLGHSVKDSIFIFNKNIIDATHDLVCAYKPNMAFYESLGHDGLFVLSETIEYSKKSYPDIPVILDFKRTDIGNTNLGYVKLAFEILGVDAVTVHPYLGKEALKPFLDCKDKGIIVLAKTSNVGASEFQDLPVGDTGEPLYKVVARHVASFWNENGNCALVVGATYTKELKDIRSVVGDIPLLIPGIGVQGGEIEPTVAAGKDSRGWGMIINSSRDVIFASRNSDYQTAAREVTMHIRDQINRYR